MIKDIFVPPRIKEGIKPTSEKFKPAEVWALDFETVKGKPYTIQIQHPKGMYFKYLKNPGDGFAHLMNLAAEREVEKLRVYVWSASYDFPCLFFNLLHEFTEKDWTRTFVYGGRKAKVTISCDKSWFGTIAWGKVRIRLLDAFQFFRMGLDRAARDLLGHKGKLKKPAGLGERKLKTKHFERYAKLDAHLTRKIALLIEKAHEQYGIDATVSASQFASKVLRCHFLKRTVPYPGVCVEKAGALSYHGGANWVTDSVPAFIKGVTEYDLTSAYPFAFVEMPNFAGKSGRWVRSKNFRRGDWGFVRVSFTHQCGYYGVRGHRFECINAGTVWTTSHEYLSSRACLKGCKVLDGWVWRGGGRSPFADYMEHFFKEKKNAKNEADRYFAKICLNGISGKLVQNRETKNGTFRAGGLFNPALASLVTGHTRGRMHSLLHEYSGFHCATDSLFTRATPDLRSEDLGGLHRSTHGDLLLLRNKLYIFFRRNSKSILKWGAHGFWGKQEDLIRLWRTRTTDYTCSHIYKVREAFIRNPPITPLEMVQVERQLAICWDDYTEEMKDGQENRHTAD